VKEYRLFLLPGSRAQRTCEAVADARSADAAASLSKSDNSIEQINVLTGTHRRVAFGIACEIKALANTYGIDRLGFLTLTFAEKKTPEIKDCNRRFNSLASNILKARYCRAVVCLQRSPKGRVHFHLVVVLRADIRTGFDFDAAEKMDYRSAGRELRSEWAFWRKTAPAYSFGRTELLPIRSSAEGIAHYVGGYVGRHVEHRIKADKGARVVRYIGYGLGRDREGRMITDRKASCRFSWNSVGGWLWRQRVAAFANLVGGKTIDDLKILFGPKWCYLFREEIARMPVGDVEVWPSAKHWESYNSTLPLHQGEFKECVVVKARSVRLFRLARSRSGRASESGR